MPYIVNTWEICGFNDGFPCEIIASKLDDDSVWFSVKGSYDVFRTIQKLKTGIEVNSIDITDTVFSTGAGINSMEAMRKFLVDIEISDV